jgi:hypothetical protein
MIFTKEFNDVKIQDIVNAIQSQGYFCFERALTPEFIATIENDVMECGEAKVNKNWIGGVHTDKQYYLTHMLAVSKVFFDYATHSKVFEICQATLGEAYRLKAMRYYETYNGGQQRWHTDNKVNRTFSEIPGVIFISYISDVDDGEFQYVRGSQVWSGQNAYNEYDEKSIDEKYSNDIISFKMPRGSIIIYDTYGIHRAKPVFSSGFVRKSLFLQVDTETKNAEPTLLNASFLGNLDDETKRYLGFGLPSEYEVFPATSYSQLPILSHAGRELFRWIPERVLRGVYEAAPNSLKRMVKKMIRS